MTEEVTHLKIGQVWFIPSGNFLARVRDILGGAVVYDTIELDQLIDLGELFKNPSDLKVKRSSIVFSREMDNFLPTPDNAILLQPASNEPMKMVVE